MYYMVLILTSFDQIIDYSYNILLIYHKNLTYTVTFILSVVCIFYYKYSFINALYRKLWIYYLFFIAIFMYIYWGGLIQNLRELSLDYFNSLYLY